MSKGCNCPPQLAALLVLAGEAHYSLTSLCKPHHAVPPPLQPSETRPPDYSLRIQKSLTVGAKQLHGVSHCVGRWRAVLGASPPGSSQAKGVVCGSRGKPLRWCRGSKMGVLLGGCRAGPSLQRCSWAPTASPEASSCAPGQEELENLF